MFGPPLFREIIGVVQDIHQTALTDPPPAVLYTPFEQDPRPSFTVVVRSRRDSGEITRAVRAAVTALEPEQP